MPVGLKVGSVTSSGIVFRIRETIRFVCANARLPSKTLSKFYRGGLGDGFDHRARLEYRVTVFDNRSSRSEHRVYDRSFGSEAGHRVKAHVGLVRLLEDFERNLFYRIGALSSPLNE